VRSYTLRKDYKPSPRPASRPADSVADACRVLAESIIRRDSTYKEVERRLLIQVYEGTGSFQEAARLLGIDWRTLRARVKAGSGQDAD
jgi:transcriptional regulator with GAF, ATPase, and Fis domain